MSTAMDEGNEESGDEQDDADDKDVVSDQPVAERQAEGVDRTREERTDGGAKGVGDTGGVGGARDVGDTEGVGSASGGEAATRAVEAGSPSRDELFHVLRNRRRRFAIHHLKRANEPVDVGELATQIAAWENDVPADEVTSQQRRRVYNALQQTHVPKLDETGLVDTDRRDVELTARASELDVYLEVVEGRDVPWSQYYLGVGVLGGGVAGASAFDLGPFVALPDAGAAVFLAVAVVVSAAAHYAYQRRDRLGTADRPPELRGE